MRESQPLHCATDLAPCWLQCWHPVLVRQSSVIQAAPCLPKRLGEVWAGQVSISGLLRGSELA
jgi:hypothetical protein